MSKSHFTTSILIAFIIFIRYNEVLFKYWCAAAMILYFFKLKNKKARTKLNSKKKFSLDLSTRIHTKASGSIPSIVGLALTSRIPLDVIKSSTWIGFPSKITDEPVGKRTAFHVTHKTTSDMSCCSVYYFSDVPLLLPTDARVSPA